MVTKCGGVPKIVSRPAELHAGNKVILAGVGSFDAGIQALQDHGWQDALTEAVRNHRVTVLGICLGMQLMCRSSEEGRLPGLGWIDADVRSFEFTVNGNLKIPHMGWNTVTIAKPNPLLTQDEDEQRFYFVHSYHAVCDDADDVLATTHHGYNVTAAFSHDNIYGVQFHPEKSHRFGMTLMTNFVQLGC